MSVVRGAGEQDGRSFRATRVASKNDLREPLLVFAQLEGLHEHYVLKDTWLFSIDLMEGGEKHGKM
jgi:hypothetical protein